MSGVIERWPPLRALQLRQALDDVSRLVAHPEYDLDRNLEAHQALCRFLVIRSCGYLETSTIEICRAYVQAKSGGPVQSFANSRLVRSGANPSIAYLVKFIGRFILSLANEFEQFAAEDDGRIQRDVDFLVSRRNRIAHGESEGINRTRAIQLKEVSCEVADWFILRFNPNL
jgi:HEPN superfamily RiboL-PSP-like protein